MSCHDIRPLLAARAEELTPLEARMRAEHVATCSRCATESAAYTRLGLALASMAHLEAEPADGTLERVLIAIGRRRTRVTDPRVVVAAGSAGALVATVVVARALRQRRHAQARVADQRFWRRLPLPGLSVPAPALARAK